MALNDDKKKRDALARPGTQIGHLTLIPGSGADRAAKAIGGYIDRQVGEANASIAAGKAERQAQADRTGKPVYDGAGGILASPTVARHAATTPVRNPVVSTVGGGGSTPTGGVPASPRPVPSPAPLAKPDFSGARGNVVAPLASQPTGIQRTEVNGVPTFTGTGAYAPAQARQAAPLARPALVNPSIAPVYAPSVNAQTENTDQRRAREAAISEIGTQLFLNRGKTTRSARDLTSDLLRTQADLTNTAGNQAVALKNNNLDAQTRADLAALQNQGENDRTVAEQSGANARALLADDGETARTKLALDRPETITGADNSLLRVTGDVARPITTADGQGVKAPTTKGEGAVTPAVLLDSLTKELEAAQASLTPDNARIGALQTRIDHVREGGNPKPQQAPSAPGVGATRNGYQFLGGDPADPRSWKKVK